MLKELSALSKAKKGHNVKGYDWRSFRLLFWHYGHRLFGTSALWFLNDVYFYGEPCWWLLGLAECLHLLWHAVHAWCESSWAARSCTANRRMQSQDSVQSCMAWEGPVYGVFIS